MNSLQELTSAIRPLGNICGWADGWTQIKQPVPSCCPSLSSVAVHILVFEKWTEPVPHHGAPLHHPQISGGAGQHVQPGLQESLLVQTSSAAPEEGESSAGGRRLSLTEQRVFLSLCSSQLFLDQAADFDHLKHRVDHVDHLCLTPLLAFTVV